MSFIDATISVDAANVWRFCGRSVPDAVALLVVRYCMGVSLLRPRIELCLKSLRCMFFSGYYCCFSLI